MCAGGVLLQENLFFFIGSKRFLTKKIYTLVWVMVPFSCSFLKHYYYCLISEKKASKFLGGTNSGQTGYKVKKPNSETGFSEPRVSTSSCSGRQTQDEAEDWGVRRRRRGYDREFNRLRWSEIKGILHVIWSENLFSKVPFTIQNSTFVTIT